MIVQTPEHTTPPTPLTTPPLLKAEREARPSPAKGHPTVPGWESWKGVSGQGEMVRKGNSGLIHVLQILVPTLLGRGPWREYGIDGLLDLSPVALGVRGGRLSELALELVEHFGEREGHVRETDMVRVDSLAAHRGEESKIVAGRDPRCYLAYVSFMCQ